jgi:hypothetical protein
MPVKIVLRIASQMSQLDSCDLGCIRKFRAVPWRHGRVCCINLRELPMRCVSSMRSLITSEIYIILAQKNRLLPSATIINCLTATDGSIQEETTTSGNTLSIARVMVVTGHRWTPRVLVVVVKINDLGGMTEWWSFHKYSHVSRRVSDVREHRRRDVAGSQARR